jgi:hypothetical protein
MSKSVSIRVRSVTAAAVMAKQRTQAGGSHGLASMGAFERKKEIRGVAKRSFHP